MKIHHIDGVIIGADLDPTHFSDCVRKSMRCALLAQKSTFGADSHAGACPFGQAWAEDLQGTVTHVRDGDTIEVGNMPIRLNGLHAPELDRRGGKRAAAFMRDLVLHTAVTCSLTGEKSYDRFVGTCWLDGADIAGELVSAGLGRDCPRYSGGRYAALERDSAKSMPLPGYCEPR